MPSNDTKSKQSIRRRPHVGRKIKFYETKDEEDDAKFNPPMKLDRDTQRTISKSATLPNRKKSSDVRPSVIDVTSKLRVRSARNRDNTAKADEDVREQPKEYFDTNIQLDENDNVATKSRRSVSRERRSKEKTRGLNDNSDTKKLPTSALNESQDDLTLPQGFQAEEQAIPFLSTQDIGRIYQSQPDKGHVNREYVSLSPDPDEYHWKIVESRKNLQELQKSLSNDFSGENLQSITNDHQPNSVDTTPEVLRTPAHLRVSKQESNTSVSSNISTSSTISKKLLSLSETTKSEKLPRRRSQKSRSKDSSWTQESLNSRERSGSQTYRVTATSRRQRKTISGIQYNEDDVKSPTNPPTEAAVSNAKEKDVNTRPASDDTIRSDAAEQGACGTFTSASSPPDIDTKDDPSNDFFNNHSSNSSELHMDDQIDGSGIGESDHKNLSSSVRVRSRETKIVPDKETPKARSHSAKFNSMPRMTSKYIFKVDLDQQQDSQYSSRAYRYRSRRSSRQDDEPSHELQSKRREHETPKSKSEKTKRDDIDNEPKKTPSSIHPEPVSTHSKRLQVRPWNMLGHLSNNVTQTARTTTRDTVSQTKKQHYESTSTQTGEKTYKTIGIQTDAVVTKQEFAAQINPSVKTVEVQTTDELSEGATISLDNLIRMGAIKRTKSLGLGLSSPNMERPIVRSSSSNCTTNLRKEATEVNSNKTVTVSSDGTETSGKIASYNWNENKKFVKIFVSYSGIHLLPSKNIQVKTNGINMLLTVEECVSRTKDGEELRTLTSTLYLNRLRRPVSCLSYNVQRDMVTIMLRKQKQTPWNALLFSGANA